MSDVLCITSRTGTALRRWLAAAAATWAATVGSPAHAQALHNVLLVGNSQSGTVSFIADGSFANLGSINVIPDLQ